MNLPNCTPREAPQRRGALRFSVTDPPEWLTACLTFKRGMNSRLAQAFSMWRWLGGS